MFSMQFKRGISELCKNKDQTCLFLCTYICRVSRNIHSSPEFKQSPRDPANVNAWKNVYNPYIV